MNHGKTVSLPKHPQNAGFTLVEMAIVVTIMAVLMTLGITTAMNLLRSSQLNTTKERQSYVRDALTAYFMTNHRFPCPDNGGATVRDGVEDRAVLGVVTSNCVVNFGTVPFATLGIARSQAVDAYGNFMSYRVDNLNGWHLSATFPVSPGVCPVLPLPATAVSVYSAPTLIEANALAGGGAAVVLISHGPNGSGAWNQGTTNASRNALPTTTPELGNTQTLPAGPAGYRNYVFSDSGAAPFDDVVSFITHANLNVVSNNIKRTDLCNP